MSGSTKSLPRRLAEAAIAMGPWVLAMYLFYWLDSSGTWTSETPHRGKLSVALLAGGMLLSLLTYTWMRNKDRQ